MSATHPAKDVNRNLCPQESPAIETSHHVLPSTHAAEPFAIFSEHDRAAVGRRNVEPDHATTLIANARPKCEWKHGFATVRGVAGHGPVRRRGVSAEAEAVDG